MGKGDRKTTKGKRVMGSHGNTRPSKSTIRAAKKSLNTVAEKPVKAEEPKKTTVKKPAAAKVPKEKAAAPKAKKTTTKSSAKKDEA